MSKPTATPPPPKPGTKLDVRTPGSSGTINGAVFKYANPQPTGTGVLDPFLRVQHTPTEQGYNTDGGFPFDDKTPSNFQHSLLQSSLASFTMNGVQYYKFILDANQSGTSTSDHSLSLDQIQVYTSMNGAQTTQTFNPDGTVAFDSTTHLAYNLNIGGLTGNSVITTATGSGIGNMYMYVPVSDFFRSDKYVILYFFAGSTYASTGGFEEWAAFTKSTVPDNGSGLILGGIAFGALVLARTIVTRASRKRLS